MADKSKSLEKAADDFLANLARNTRAKNNWQKPTWAQRSVHIGCTVTGDTTDVEKTMAILADGKVFRVALENFVQNELLGPEGVMYQMYHSKMTHDYLPEVMNQKIQYSSLSTEVAEKINARGEGKKRRVYDPSAEAFRMQEAERKAQGMMRGFADLWRALSVFSVSVNDGVVTAGIGPESQVTNLRMSDYMRVQGSEHTASPFNTLFYGVEYGTGVYADYNGDVRLDGPTKDEDGSWWLGKTAGTGLHFAGQKGFHFLYEERSRRPQGYITQQIKQKFPQYVLDALKSARETQ